MRRKDLIISVLTSLLFLGVTETYSQTTNTTNAPESKTAKPTTGRRTVYDFDEADILGKLKRPEGQSIVEPPEFRFRRLLDLDESFLPNIVRSVDEY
jgi:hypothetical protein